MGYSLQANSKTREGTQHIDRDAQFQYINAQAKAFLTAGQLETSPKGQASYDYRRCRRSVVESRASEAGQRT
jgi:hypothetical protein